MTPKVSLIPSMSTLFHTAGFPRGFRPFLAAVTLFAAFLALAPAQSLAPADPVRYIHDIQVLSAPNIEGSGAGSKGLTRAQKILVQRYASLGLEPKGTNDYL
jgi:hypothetical protein